MLKIEALTMIDYIRKTGYKPSDWEASFMQSIELSGFEKLSFKQTRAVETIYSKATSGGLYQKREYGYRA